MSSTTDLLPLPYRAHDLDGLLAGWQKTLVDAYRWMVLARTLDGRMLALQRQGRVGFYGPATGQEAVSVGTALALSPRTGCSPGSGNSSSPWSGGILSATTWTISSRTTGTRPGADRCRAIRRAATSGTPPCPR